VLEKRGCFPDTKIATGSGKTLRMQAATRSVTVDRVSRGSIATAGDDGVCDCLFRFMNNPAGTLVVLDRIRPESFIDPPGRLE
jgi:hypothetical protein